MDKEKRVRRRTRRTFDEDMKEQEEWEEQERERAALRRKFIETVSPHQREVRDKLLTHCIMLEAGLEEAIAWHFCKNRTLVYTFIANLLGREFSRKQELLETLLKSLHSDLYNQAKDIFQPLREITKLRNSIVHSGFMVPDFISYFTEEELKNYYTEAEYRQYQESFRDDGLTFNFRGKMEFYSLERISSLTTKAKGVYTVLNMLQGELTRRARGEKPELLDEKLLGHAKRNWLSGTGLQFRKLPSRPKTT